jgi:hypothetical protein
MGLFTVFHNCPTLEKRKKKKSSPKTAMRFIVFGSVEATNIHKAKEHCVLASQILTIYFSGYLMLVR